MKNRLIHLQGAKICSEKDKKKLGYCNNFVNPSSQINDWKAVR